MSNEKKAFITWNGEMTPSIALSLLALLITSIYTLAKTTIAIDSMSNNQSDLIDTTRTMGKTVDQISVLVEDHERRLRRQEDK